MKRLFIVLVILVVGIVESSCSRHNVRYSPLTEKEKQDLGTVGIAAEMSALDVMQKRHFSADEYAMREIRDRLVDTGDGALKGGVVGLGIVGAVCHRSVPNIACLLSLPVGITVGAIAGGVDGALNRKTYSDPPEEDHPDTAAYHTVQELIDDLGLPAKLRDKIWEKVYEDSEYKFELVPELPPAREDHLYRAEWSRYWPLRDKGIRTLFQVRIPVVEFRGSGADQPYQLIVPVEITLLDTSDQSCVRQRSWEYRGESHLVAEWNENEAKLFNEELDKFFDLVAKHVTSSFFGKEFDLSREEHTTVIPIEEIPTCPG